MNKSLMCHVVMVVVWVMPLSPVVAGNVVAGNPDVVRNLADEIRHRYVFVDVANDIAAYLQQREAEGVYRALEGKTLADQLTEDVRHIANDKHLRIRFHEQERETGNEQSFNEQLAEQARAENNGFVRAELLDGNIGVIELTEFYPVDMAQSTLDDVMAKLADAKMLIFDLRRNRGGDPATVAAITSYLFAERRHLNTMQNRIAGTEDYEHEEFHTTPVGDRALPDVPVYVLTSNATFSGGEEFSYNLKHMGRATVIGEVTGGGANPGGMEMLGDGFSAFIPSGRAVNPVTGTNWEGVGVQPHIKVPAKQAMSRALDMIRQ